MNAIPEVIQPSLLIQIIEGYAVRPPDLRGESDTQLLNRVIEAFHTTSAEEKSEVLSMLLSLIITGKKCSIIAKRKALIFVNNHKTDLDGEQKQTLEEFLGFNRRNPWVSTAEKGQKIFIFTN